MVQSDHESVEPDPDSVRNAHKTSRKSQKSAGNPPDPERLASNLEQKVQKTAGFAYDLVRLHPSDFGDTCESVAAPAGMSGHGREVLAYYPSPSGCPPESYPASKGLYTEMDRLYHLAVSPSGASGQQPWANLRVSQAHVAQG